MSLRDKAASGAAEVELYPQSVPRHVAIIPDGNRRWAKARGRRAFAGHARGVSIFEEIAAHAADRNVRYLSVWGISLDNLIKRSAKEVAGLMKLFEREFSQLATAQSIHDRQTHISVLGRWQEKFPAPVRQAMAHAIDATAQYSRHFLTFLMAYNGTDDMLQAVQGVADAAGAGRMRVTADVLKRHLFTKDLPPVDLVIRTGGEPHLSAGFMMWDLADADLYFTDALWPDFSRERFDAALAYFGKRERRLGK